MIAFMKRCRMFAFGLLAVVLLLAIPTAEAQSDYKGWRFRAWGGVVCRCVESDDVTFDDPTYGLSATEAGGTSFGVGIDFEYRFTKLFGLDLAIGYTEMDVDFKQSLTPTVATDTLAVLPIWLAANFHVVNTKTVDFWVAPQIAFVSWNDPLTFPVPGEPTFVFETKNEFPALGLALGVDWWLSEKNGLNFAFRFIDADADEGHNLPVDPTFITVGYARRF
jgi:outer membrane protein W